MKRQSVTYTGHSVDSILQWAQEHDTENFELVTSLFTYWHQMQRMSIWGDLEKLISDHAQKSKEITVEELQELLRKA